MHTVAASHDPLAKPKHQSGIRAALHNVHWGYLFFGVINIVAAAVTWDLFEPNDKPFVLYDASLSRPVKDVTFSVPVAMAVSIVLALCQLAVCEFVLMRGVRSSTARWATFIQALLHIWFVFWFQSFIQQLFASWVGKQRPSFLAECDPTAAAYSSVELPVFRPNGQFVPFTVNRSVCTNVKNAKDASKSFFSGHASSTAVIQMFTIAWFYYTLTVRAPARWSGAQVAPSRASYRLWDFKRAAVLFFNCAQMFFFLVVGATRYIDNKHHIEDVVTGWFVGTLFAAVGVWDFISIEREMMARLAIPAAEERLPTHIHAPPMA